MRWHALVLLGCSWILWQAASDLATQRTTYTVTRAEDTKTACEAAKRRQLESEAVEQRLGDFVMLKGLNGQLRTVVTFVCLPDTVDPRGK